MEQEKSSGQGTPQNLKRFQILSLDGGGIKGLFSAAVLTYLEEDLEIKVVDHFDLIVGTSTGGIIAIGLGLGLSPREIMEFYITKSSEIFPSKFLGRLHEFLVQVLRRKYDNAPLKQALQECFGEKLLGESKCRLVIPSYNLSEDEIYLFKTPHHERLRRDYKVPAWRVALAASAAPTYLPCFKGIDGLRLIDGGIWCNNPSVIGLTEAIGVLGVGLEAVSILSVGTTDEMANRPKSLDEGGYLAWKDQAVKILMRGQSLGALAQAELILGKDKILRIDPIVPEGLFRMDKIAPEDHIAKAAHQSRKIIPEIEKRFMDHEAPEFDPYYRVQEN